MAQSVELLTLDLGSGHDPGVVGSSPVSGSALSVEPAYDFLSLSLCPSPHTHTLSLSKMRSNNNDDKFVNTTVAKSNLLQFLWHKAPPPDALGHTPSSLWPIVLLCPPSCCVTPLILC